MPDCSVNGTAYPAADLPTDYESVTRAGYAQSMTLVSERPTSAANRRIWPIRFELLTESQLSTLRAALKAPGTVTLAGDLVGASYTCLATQISWESGDLADMFGVNCTFIEVTPS